MMERCTLGGGCFWGVEALFQRVEGVVTTAVGYMGGTLENPTYETVCDGDSGHAEVVQIIFDADHVTYRELLERFFRGHDPTELNRQGEDVGLQYRSVIFYDGPQQRAAALETREQVDRSGQYEQPVVTEIAPAVTFYRAEEYHQQYLDKRG